MSCSHTRSVLAEGDAIGSLVDDAETEVLQQRHALRERQRHIEREHLQVHACFVVALAAVEIDGARPRLRELLQKRDVGDGLLGPESLAIGGAEGFGIAGGERTRPCAADGLVERVAQGVAPGADDGGNALLQGLSRHLRRLALVAADDVMRARERPFRIGRIGGGHAPLVDRGEELADAQAGLRVVAVLGHEDEDRHEAVELVDAGERTHPRTLRQVHDVDGEVVERVLVDLEQLVARIVLEHVEERAARIARRVEAGAGDQLRHLEAQVRHLGGGVGIGARREQADDAQFAAQAPVLVEQLDADIVEMRPAVDAGFHVRLGDDEGLRPLQEGADFRRHRHELAPAPQHAHGRIAQEPEARALHRIGGGVARRQPVFA